MIALLSTDYNETAGCKIPVIPPLSIICIYYIVKLFVSGLPSLLAHRIQQGRARTAWHRIGINRRLRNGFCKSYYQTSYCDEDWNGENSTRSLKMPCILLPLRRIKREVSHNHFSDLAFLLVENEAKHINFNNKAYFVCPLSLIDSFSSNLTYGSDHEYI